MEKIILPALRSHVPGVNDINGKPTWYLPIHVLTKKGIDFDYGPLLLFDQVAIDGQSKEYIESSKLPELIPIRESMNYLIGEGYIEVHDFGSDLTKARKIIDTHVEKIITDPVGLREPVLRGIEGYRKTLPLLKNTFQDQDHSLWAHGFGMHLLLLKEGNINSKRVESISKLMSSQKKRWTKDEIDDIKEIIRPTITSLYQKLVLSEMYEVPFLDVDYTSEMYSILRKESLRAFNNEANLKSQRVATAQNMFDCIIPQLRPTSPKKMLNLLRQPAIKDFREYVTNAANDGQSITKDDFISLLQTTFLKERQLGEARDKIAWGERALSLFPVAGW